MYKYCLAKKKLVCIKDFYGYEILQFLLDVQNADNAPTLTVGMELRNSDIIYKIMHSRMHIDLITHRKLIQKR